MLGVGEQHVARRVALGQLEADVAIEGRHGARLAVDAEGAAALEHARDERGIQHARHVARQVEVLLDLRLAVGVELAVEHA